MLLKNRKTTHIYTHREVTLTTLHFDSSKLKPKGEWEVCATLSPNLLKSI